MSDQSLFNYGVQGVYVGGRSPYSPAFESIATVPIEGVQSANITLELPRVDSSDWAGCGGPVMVNRPRATLEFTYVFASGFNEPNLGFITNGLVPCLTSMNGENNFYVLIDKDHQDLVGYQGTNSNVMAFGNGVMTRYGFEAGVGRLSLVTVGVEALNLLIQASGTNQTLPSVFYQSGTYPTGQYTLPVFNQQIHDHFETRPASIVLTFDSGCAIGAMLSGATTCPIQNFGFSIDMSRQDTKKLGWAYPATRSLHYPLKISLHADAYLNNFQLDALNRMDCPDSGYNFAVGFKSSCTTTDTFSFQFNGALLDNQSFASQIGDLNKVTFNWSLTIPDVNRLGANMFMTSNVQAFNSIFFPEASWGSGAGQLPLEFDLSSYCYISIASGPAIITGGNYVVISDDSAQTVVQLNVSGSSEIEQIVVNVG